MNPPRKTKSSRRTVRKKRNNDYGLSHDDLILFAAKWLQRFCSVTITEMSTSAGEECDAIGFTTTGTALIECKATRSDFLSDAKKRVRKHPEQGMGDLRLYMAPKGLIDISELPAGWGMIECTKKQMRTIKKSQLFKEKNSRGERLLLVSALRRIGQHATHGVSVRPYVYSTRNRATLGVLEETI